MSTMQQSTVLNSSCEPCRQSKVKCSGELVCQRCKAKGYNCLYNPRKKRGKARDTIGGLHSKVLSSDASDTEGQETVALLDNEVSHFCAENAFPMKFISRLRKANITDFLTAAQITEEELSQRFGDLPFELLLKWRCRMKQFQFSEPKVSFPPTLPITHETSINYEENKQHHFDESQCAQVLSSLQTNPSLCNMTPIHLQNFSAASQSCPANVNSLNSLNNSFKLFGLNPSTNFVPFGLSAMTPLFSSCSGNPNAFSSASVSASSLTNDTNGFMSNNASAFCKSEANSYWNTYVQNLMNFCSNKAVIPKEFLDKIPNLQTGSFDKNEKTEAENETQVAVTSNSSSKCLIQKIMNKMNHCKKRKGELLKLNSRSELPEITEKTENLTTEMKSAKEVEAMEEDTLSQEKCMNICKEVKMRLETMDNIFCFLNKLMKLKNSTFNSNCSNVAKDISVKSEDKKEVESESLIELRTYLETLTINCENLDKNINVESKSEAEKDTENSSWTCVKKEEVCCEFDFENIDTLQNKALELLFNSFEKLKLSLDLSKYQ